MTLWVYVAAGGVAGTLARLAVAGLMAPGTGPSVPWATLAVNLSGSFLLGLLARALPEWGASAEVRAMLTVGFCGAFTTFSTFGLETVALLQRGAPGLAAAYVLGSVALGVAGVAVGLWAGGFA